MVTRCSERMLMMDTCNLRGAFYRTARSSLKVRRLSTFGLVMLTSFLSLLVACERRATEDPDSPTVRLRNNLRAIATGTIDNVSGKTLPNESYVLLYGYQGPIDSLPISPSLQNKLADLVPVDYERFVLVHTVGDDVTEYTQWEAGEAPLFSQLPFLIRGNPFRVTGKRQGQQVVLTVNYDQ